VAAHEPFAGFEVVAEEKRLFASSAGEWIEKPVTLMRVPGALPRAFLATHALREDEANQRSVMRRGAFDGTRTLYVDGEVPKEHEGTNDGILPVEVAEHREDRVVLRAHVPEGGGWVVLLDAFSADWSATVDGQTRPVLVADAIFRAVRVEAGEHTIVFAIGPPVTFYLGCALALLGVVLGIRLRARVRSGGAPRAP